MSLHTQILGALAGVADQLQAKAAAVLDAEGVSVSDVASLMTSLAALTRSFQPLQLISFEFSSQVSINTFGYSLEGLIGYENVAFLVVDGAIIPRSRFSWDADVGLLSLAGDYRIEAGQTAELYLQA